MADFIIFNEEDREVIDNIINVAEELDFSVDVTSNDTGYDIEFSKYSPAGKDFSFSIDVKSESDEIDIADKIEEYYDDYDVSYETYLWLDNFGHGTNGAPYEMIDVYKDTETCKEYIKELADQIYEEYR